MAMLQKCHTPSDFFNVAFNRRGLSFYKEYSRVIKKGGAYVEIGIGEQDTRALKEYLAAGRPMERGLQDGLSAMRSNS